MSLDLVVPLILNDIDSGAAALGTSYERLSTGLRINHASDDPAGLALAARFKLDSTVYGQGQRNANDGISRVSYGQSALDSLTNTLTEMQALATSATNGSLTDTQRQSMDSQFQALLTEYNRVATLTDGNGQPLFTTNLSLTVQAGFGQSGTIQAALTGGSSTNVADGTFQAAQTDTTAAQSAGVVSADFNGDGKLDLVTADFGTTNVSVLLGNGDGTFQAKKDFVTGANPLEVATGDFNGDGKTDIAVSNFSSATVSVFLGNGDGTFLAKKDFTVGTQPEGIATADVNGDGKLDLVTGDEASNTISVLLGNGNGTFLARQTFAGASGPEGVTIGDFNDDGKLDIAAANVGSNSVSVFLGNGNGTFQAKHDYTVGAGPRFLISADLNGDGILDLAVDNTTGNSVSVLFGNSNGSFQTQRTLATPADPNHLQAVDINNDGNMDLVVASGAGSVVALDGTGDGNFESYQTLVSAGGDGLNVRDFNGDGTDDIAATSLTTSLTVALGHEAVTPVNYVQTLSGLNVLSGSSALSAENILGLNMDALTLVGGMHAGAEDRLESASDLSGELSTDFANAASQILDVDVPEEVESLTRDQLQQQQSQAALRSVLQSLRSSSDTFF